MFIVLILVYYYVFMFIIDLFHVML